MTNEEKQSIAQDVLTLMKGESLSVDELTGVTSLEGLQSLPAMSGTTLVAAPLSLLSKPAEEAAATAQAATAAAATATTSANAAATAAQAAKSEAEKATETANTAAANATEAAQKARVAADYAETTAEDCAAKAEEAVGTAVESLSKRVEELMGLLIPTGLEVEPVGRMTIGNLADRHIEARLTPAEVRQNILYVSDGRAVTVAQDGRLTAVSVGQSVVQIVPTLNTALAQAIVVEVGEPTLRKATSEALRLTSGGGLLMN